MSTATAVAAELRPALVTVEQAHVVALAEHELVDRNAATARLRALRRLQDSPEAAPSDDDAPASPELLDPERTEAGIAEAALRISVRNHLAGLKEAFLIARTALVDRAALDRRRRVRLDGETVNLGALLLAHERVLARHTQRIGDLMGRLNLSPAAGDLSAETRDRIGALLGFAKADASARDASTARDHLAELAQLHAGTAASIARVHGELVALGAAIADRRTEPPLELAAAAADALGAALALETAGGAPLPQVERSWAIGAGVIQALRAIGETVPELEIAADPDPEADATAQDTAESLAVDEVRQHRGLLDALALQLADASLELDDATDRLLGA